MGRRRRQHTLFQTQLLRWTMKDAVKTAQQHGQYSLGYLLVYQLVYFGRILTLDIFQSLHLISYNSVYFAMCPTVRWCWIQVSSRKALASLRPLQEPQSRYTIIIVRVVLSHSQTPFRLGTRIEYLGKQRESVYQMQGVYLPLHRSSTPTPSHTHDTHHPHHIHHIHTSPPTPPQCSYVIDVDVHVPWAPDIEVRQPLQIKPLPNVVVSK